MILIPLAMFLHSTILRLWSMLNEYILLLFFNLNFSVYCFQMGFNLRTLSDLSMWVEDKWESQKRLYIVING